MQAFREFKKQESDIIKNLSSQNDGISHINIFSRNYQEE